MQICREIDLKRSLTNVFGNRPGAGEQIEIDYTRQVKTAEAILDRFLSNNKDRMEFVILADEVGLGKTFVALAVAASILDLIREGRAPADFPSNKPYVLVLTPRNDALYNKWQREAITFQKDCVRKNGDLDWLTIKTPLEGKDRSGNIVDLSGQIRESTKSQPRIIIAKMGVFGARLHDTKNWWRRRALASIFHEFNIDTESRKRCCRKTIDSGARENVPELLDLRSSGFLWEDDANLFSADPFMAYKRALQDKDLSTRIQEALKNGDGDWLTDLLDELTRAALIGDWPQIPLIVIDEIHNLKNESTTDRRNLERFLEKKACRLLGLSATPFQLYHEELLNVLGLRTITDLSPERRAALNAMIENLDDAMKGARRAGKEFRETWLTLRQGDQPAANALWKKIEVNPEASWPEIVQETNPPRLARAFCKAAILKSKNRQLGSYLRPFIIRHRHNREYRRYWVGKNALASSSGGSSNNFVWVPGIEVEGDAELFHYLLMRMVSMAKHEKGKPGLGAELTGSYRHLVETSATWRSFGSAKNSLLPTYKSILENCITKKDSDKAHPKIRVTVERAIRAFESGQKTLIFCVHIKTAEAIRDEVERKIEETLGKRRDKIFGSGESFEYFRRRFFNRREPLYLLIQDYPLLGILSDEVIGIPENFLLGEEHLRELCEILIGEREDPTVEKPDRRMILAIVEHLAVRTWEQSESGRIWLDSVLNNCQKLRDSMARRDWVPKRGLLTLSPRFRDPEASIHVDDPLLAEEADIDRGKIKLSNKEEGQIEAWLERFRREPIGGVIAPFFQKGILGRTSKDHVLPLLPRYHCNLLTQLDLETRRAAGQVFRRILMAEEFLIRYLADAPRDQSEFWADYLARRYTEPLKGHRESLRDRVHAYLDTLVRAQANPILVEGYREASMNLNVVQLVKGGMKRDRYFLGFNTPYRPEILVSTSVGQEGIDLHRECRHVIHHDLCWNPATIEQRTGRVDRIGSKLERERAEPTDEPLPTLDIAIPYLAATYDERMFEELYRRAQLFEVTLGGEFRVEGRISQEEVEKEIRRRKEMGVGSEDEDFGSESETGAIDLPTGMVEQLRIDLSVWKHNGNALK